MLLSPNFQTSITLTLKPFKDIVKKKKKKEKSTTTKQNKTNKTTTTKRSILEKEMSTHSSILGNPVDRAAWWAIVQVVINSRTQLSECAHRSIWASQVVLMVKNPTANAGNIRTQVWFLVRKTPWRRTGKPFQYFSFSFFFSKSR